MATTRDDMAERDRRERMSIPFRIAWISRLQTQRFDMRAKGVGLTRAQWRVIATIALNEGLAQSDVASRLEIANVTAGRIIDRLEEMGFVERRSDPDDRRVNRLHLTAVAKPVLEQLSAVGAEEETIELDGFSDEERGSLTIFLDRMIGNLIDKGGSGADEPAADAKYVGGSDTASPASLPCR